MNRLLKVAAYVVGVVVVLLIASVVTVYAVSSRKIAKTFPTAVATLTIPDDEAAIERGRHLVISATACQDCHGMDLGGTVIFEPGPMGYLPATNLTSGRGGIGATYSTDDWIRAIRHGVRPDGTSLWIMPSSSYAKIGDADLAAMIAYLKTLPPVDREFEPKWLGPVGRVLVATGQIPLLIAEETPHFSERPTVEVAATVDYGRYLAGIGGCISCHGTDLAGGIEAGPPGSPPSTNLTSVGLATWSEADFVVALREGRRPDGSEINEVMPWRFSGKMTDEELHAIWLFLQSVPGAETPVRR
jgi:mono/diheme cytochrome c family protein